MQPIIRLRGTALTSISVFAAAVGPVLFGLSTGYPSPAGLTLKNAVKVDMDGKMVRVDSPDGLGIMTAANVSLFGSILSLGAMLGCFLGSFASDFLGRKGGILLCSPIFAAANVVVALGQSATLLIISRFVQGATVGALVTCTTLYISEIAPARLRGALGSSSQISIMAGTSLAYFLGGFVFRAGDNGEFCNWRVLAWSYLVPACLIFSLMLFICPESPRWLTMKDREPEAKAVLSALRGGEEHLTEAEINSLVFVPPVEGASKATLIRDNWKQLSFAVMIMTFRMLSGIHILSYFRELIFAEAGMANPQLWALLSSLVAIVTATAAAFIVDKLGRKALFIGADLAMALGYVLLGVAFTSPSLKMLSVVALIFASGSFSLGVGPVPFILGPELLANDVRALGVGIGGSLQWAVSFLTAKTQLDLKNAMGNEGVFFLYAGVCVMMAVVVGLLVPETKGKSFEEIQAYFKGANKKETEMKTVV